MTSSFANYPITQLPDYPITRLPNYPIQLVDCNAAPFFAYHTGGRMRRYVLFFGLAAFLHASLASAQNPIAIVGARLVDGTGTVPVEDSIAVR